MKNIQSKDLIYNQDVKCSTQSWAVTIASSHDSSHSTKKVDGGRAKAEVSNLQRSISQRNGLHAASIFTQSRFSILRSYSFTQKRASILLHAGLHAVFSLQQASTIFTGWSITHSPMHYLQRIIYQRINAHSTFQHRSHRTVNPQLHGLSCSNSTHIPKQWLNVGEVMVLTDERSMVHTLRRQQQWTELNALNEPVSAQRWNLL